MLCLGFLSVSCAARPADFETSSAPPERFATQQEFFDLDEPETVQPDFTRQHLRLIQRFFLGVQLQDEKLIDSTLSARAREDGRAFLAAAARTTGSFGKAAAPRNIDYLVRGPGISDSSFQVEVRAPVEVRGDWRFLVSRTDPLCITEIRRRGAD